MATKYQGSEEERRALDAFIALTRAANAVGQWTAATVRDAGLTVSQFGVLEALHHLGPLCLKDLAEKILKSTGNLTTVVDNLESRSLVQRRRSALDRRIVNVHLTPAGSRLVRSVLPAHVEEIVRVCSVLTPEELATLKTLCRRLGTGEGSGSRPV